MPLDYIEIFEKFFSTFNNNALTDSEKYDNLKLILGLFKSESEQDPQAYINFIESIRVQLIEVLKSKFNEDVIDGIDLLNKLEKYGIIHLLRENYTKQEIIKDLYNKNNASPNTDNTIEIQETKLQQLLIFNAPINKSIDDILTRTLDQILKEMESLLGVNIEQNSQVKLFPGQVIKLLEKIKKNDIVRFKELLSMKGWEGNTLLLTALSLEHLELAEYLIENQVDFTAINDFGINVLHMLAMVHVDYNKYAENHYGTIIDNSIHQNDFSREQIIARVSQVEKILTLIKYKDPTYFINNINQPRVVNVYYDQKTASSTPLVKSLAYTKSAAYLENMLNLWRKFGAEIPENVPLAKYILGTHDVIFIKKFNDLIPNSFSPEHLNQKTKEGKTVIEEFIFISNCSIELKFATINVIKEINHNSDELISVIRNACNNKLSQAVRDNILVFTSEAQLPIVLQDPEQLFKNLEQSKDWLRLVAIYDQSENSKESIARFLNEKIIAIQSFNMTGNLVDNNKLMIIAKLDELKTYLTNPNTKDDEEKILKKYSYQNANLLSPVF